MDDVPLLALEGVCFGYPNRPALFTEIDFALRSGEQVGLHGPNGSGKTTLLRLMTGLEQPVAGQVKFRGDPVSDENVLRRLHRGIGFVMQNSDDQLFSLTVLEEVAFGPLNLGLSRREAHDRALETLAGLRLEELADRQPQRLSGGEKKMVALASVLSMRPEALLLDEPTLSLDEDAQIRMRETLRAHPLARIVVSHDRDFLEQTTSVILRLDRTGRLASGRE